MLNRIVFSLFFYRCAEIVDVPQKCGLIITRDITTLPSLMPRILHLASKLFILAIKALTKACFDPKQGSKRLMGSKQILQSQNYSYGKDSKWLRGGQTFLQYTHAFAYSPFSSSMSILIVVFSSFTLTMIVSLLLSALFYTQFYVKLNLT